MVKDTTVIIANYLHPHFINECVKSIRKFYPFVPIIIVDDYSQEEPIFEFEDVMYKRLPSHMGHGIALDYGVAEAKTKYVITMDHDIALIKEGIFEYLFSFMNNEYIIGVGKVKNNQTDISFIAPQLALWRADLIKQYKLSFSEVTLEDDKQKGFHFAVAQLLCARAEKVYGYTVCKAAKEDYIKKIGYAHYPKDQHNYKVKKI